MKNFHDKLSLMSKWPLSVEIFHDGERLPTRYTQGHEVLGGWCVWK